MLWRDVVAEVVVDGCFVAVGWGGVEGPCSCGRSEVCSL
jgi:hypothetical protein